MGDILCDFCRKWSAKHRRRSGRKFFWICDRCAKKHDEEQGT